MRLTHPDYIKLIVGICAEGVQDDTVSPLLAGATRAGIRQECFNVYTERIKNGERIDTGILKGFFGIPGEGDDFSALIQNCELDKFRPVENLLKNRLKNPGRNKVELLAWLIDFRQRPWSESKDFILNDDELIILGKKKPDISQDQNTGETKTDPAPGPGGNTVTVTKGSDDPSPETHSPEKKKSRKKTIMVACISAAVYLGGMYIMAQKENAGQLRLANANTGCMYWADTAYVAIPCNAEPKDRLIIPLDQEKMKNFKRIMREDTITERSIGRVHYIQRNKVREYYTASGNHPVEVTRSLRKLSVYMFDKYLRKNPALNDKGDQNKSARL